MAFVSEHTRWVREAQLSACLSNVAALCSSHLLVVASSCAVVGADPRVTPPIAAAAAALSDLGQGLVTTYPARAGEQVLRLTIVQRRLAKVLEDAALLRWLARFHPDALAVFIAVCESSLPSISGGAHTNR